MLPLPEVLRLARKLHAVWAGRPRPRPGPAHIGRDLDSSVAEVRRAQNRVLLAERHHLALIGPQLREELSYRLGDLARQAEQLRVEYARAVDPVPELAEWVRDLRQLESEFATVEVRWPDEVLRVVTEPIVLEDVELGPFAIEFGWDHARRFRGGARAFEVIALEPNPATGRDDVVHPHVEGRRLCAGDATEPLRQAVDEGRLTDAFLIVQSVLTTYNPRSPYVPLAEWDGFRCANCARRAGGGSRYQCEGCNCDLCGECSDSCSRCSDTRCSECLTACDVCDDRFCRSCLIDAATERLVCNDCRATCPQCRRTLAKDEVNDDTGWCAGCTEAAIPAESPPEEVSTDVH